MLSVVQEDSVYNVTSWMLLVLSSRLVDYIKEMSDRALNCATFLLEL